MSECYGIFSANAKLNLCLILDCSVPVNCDEKEARKGGGIKGVYTIPPPPTPRPTFFFFHFSVSEDVLFPVNSNQ